MPASKKPYFRWSAQLQQDVPCSPRDIAVSSLTLPSASSQGWPTHGFVKMNNERHETPAHLEHFLPEYSSLDVGFRARRCRQGFRNFLHRAISLCSCAARGVV